VKPPDKRKPGLGTPADANTKTYRQAESYTDEATERVLAEIRRWETPARLVADDPELSVEAKCRALLEMMARARRSENAAFLETAVWRGCRHLFEGDEQVPRDVIEANRRLIRRGLNACPECRRPLPSTADLDRWRELGHDLRRPA
jgi:hypothetical protein